MTAIMPAPVKHDAALARSVALPIRGSHDETTVLDLVVKPVGSDLEAIQCEGHILGYVQRAGRIFVSLLGERADRAEECGQYLVWDGAAARLSSYCSHA